MNAFPQKEASYQASATRKLGCAAHTMGVRVQPVGELGVTDACACRKKSAFQRLSHKLHMILLKRCLGQCMERIKYAGRVHELSSYLITLQLRLSGVPFRKQTVSQLQKSLNTDMMHSSLILETCRFLCQELSMFCENHNPIFVQDLTAFAYVDTIFAHATTMSCKEHS